MTRATLASSGIARENRLLRNTAKKDRLESYSRVFGSRRNQPSIGTLAGEVQHQTIGRLNLEYQEHQVNDLGANPLFMLTTTRMPAILFEAGFFPTKMNDACSPYYQQALAEALADAVETWLAAQ